MKSLQKILLLSFIIFTATVHADGPMCTEGNSSGTIDVSSCPAEKPWHCYTDYNCEDGRDYTVWGSCQASFADCW